MTRVVGQEQDATFRVVLDVRELRLNDDEFLRLCRDNRDLRLELTADGELIVMSPTGSNTGSKNSRINFRLAEWSERDVPKERVEAAVVDGLEDSGDHERSPE